MFERRYFIVAQNFHGTTLLSKLLNDHPEVVSLGDTYPSNLFDQTCGCGKLVSQCQFWKVVSDDVGADRYRSYPHLLPDYPPVFGGKVDRVLYNGLRPKRLARLMPTDSRENFAKDFGIFEESVFRNAGQPNARVFVDGVKSISRVYALIAAGVRVDGVIHLQRDPSDFIKSTTKQQGKTWSMFFSRLLTYRLFHKLARRTAGWVPYRSVTYEGLAADPNGTLEDLFRFVGVDTCTIDELISQQSQPPWHFMGNASLFYFDGTIRRSQHKISKWEQSLVRFIGGKYDMKKKHLQGWP
ncbi:hypothetical protein [Salinivibrio kushneri]|uniref:hypothetical protein n=1 Tax=Salinivibrio kushneri TaxID=1908198 RepID=UPI0022B4F033|nr:hypothetical protein [Salinivibrio kushneri]WBA17149.1 hypothetical protein O4598_08320 [Salinivibrio kushneri]